MPERPNTRSDREAMLDTNPNHFGEVPELFWANRLLQKAGACTRPGAGTGVTRLGCDSTLRLPGAGDHCEGWLHD